MKRRTDLPANKQRRLAISINISFRGGNFHETCIVELWPPNRKKAATTLIEPRVHVSTTTWTSHNNWNFNFAWISYHDISNNALWKIASPFLSCWCVSNCMTWIRLALPYSNMQNTLMFAFPYANCDQLLTSTKLDGKNTRWVKETGERENRTKNTRNKTKLIFYLCVLLFACFWCETKDAEEMCLLHVLSCEKRKRKKSQSIRTKKAGHQNNQNNMQSAAGKKSSNIPTHKQTYPMYSKCWMIQTFFDVLKFKSTRSQTTSRESR